MNTIDTQIEQRATGSLRPYPGNARTHSKKQVRQIADSITRFGFTNPVLVSDDCEIIAGHGRVMAAKLLGMSEVPTVALSHLSAAERKAYVIADNKLARNAGWDTEILAIELQGLIDLDFDVSLTGFSLAEIDFVLDDARDASAETASGPDDVRSACAASATLRPSPHPARMLPLRASLARKDAVALRGSPTLAGCSTGRRRNAPVRRQRPCRCAPAALLANVLPHRGPSPRRPARSDGCVRRHRRRVPVPRRAASPSRGHARRRGRCGRSQGRRRYPYFVAPYAAPHRSRRPSRRALRPARSRAFRHCLRVRTVGTRSRRLRSRRGVAGGHR